ncbi:hypothetical protein Agabi119p4_9895 [Agaricus bisporus var. burnettii]|uniref:DUF6533 domain-containing protein n=1 Tax=Agaricus bisporus var. burnettii TaxID=192524 RepID=A0A8H7EX30_AGABI|nr:hypothetical protein Agabi119p4_9895 [Agaricus bisporus var. burnettii]
MQSANWMIFVASLALLVYDYFLTLGFEIERFWIGRFGRFHYGSLLFFANRYLSLLGYIPVALEFFMDPRVSCQCKFLRAYNTFLVIVLQIIIACMMLMRICALYERRAWILVFSVILGICEVIIAAVFIVNPSRREISEVFLSCDSFAQNAIQYQTHYLVGGWAGVFVFDAVMFVLTLYKTVTLPKGSGVGLLTMIMRDGTVYFGIVATLNLTNILVLVLANPVNRGSMGTPMNVMSSIMMTRLMLNLRDPELNGVAQDFKTTTLNISGFHRQTNSGMSDCYSMDIHLNEHDRNV